MDVGCHYHKDLSRFLYTPNSDKIGIKGHRAKILTGQASFGELYPKRILSLLADNCLDHLHEEMLPSPTAILVVHSGAVNDRPIRKDRIRFVPAVCPVEKEHAKLIWAAALFGNEADVFSFIVFDGPILNE